MASPHRSPADRRRSSSTSTSSKTAPGCSRSRRFSIGSTAPMPAGAGERLPDAGVHRSGGRAAGPGDRLTRIQLLLSDPTTEPLERAGPQERARRLRPMEQGGALVKYIDHHAHMVSRTTDDYQQMALTGCVAVTEPAFWAGLGPQLRRQRRGLLPAAHRVRAAPRRAVRHPALHLAGGEPEGVRRPRAVARRPRADPEVPRSADGARHRRDRPQPRHAQRDRHLHRAGRARDRAPPADPDPHAAPRGQVQGHDDLGRRARAAIREIDPERVLVDHAEEHTIEMILEHGFWAGLTLYPADEDLAAARGRRHREVRPRSDLRRGRVRLGPERSDRGAALRHGDAAPAASGSADPAGGVREPGARSSASRRSSSCRPASTDVSSGAGRLTGTASPAADSVAAGRRSTSPTAPTSIRGDGWDGGRREHPPVRAGAEGSASRPPRRSGSACGSRLAMRVSCSRPTASTSSATFLDAEGLYVALDQRLSLTARSIGTPVKADVYAPDWRDEERVRYTLDLVDDPQRACCPPGMDGGVSTAPLSYKPGSRRPDAATWRTFAANVVRVVECARREPRNARGTFIHLDIEPEPDCLIETQPASSSTFFEQYLLPGRRDRCWRRRSAAALDEAAAAHLPTTCASASTAATSRSNTRTPAPPSIACTAPASRSAACSSARRST